MKTLNVGKILLLCAFVIGLASCGDDVYYTMENDDKKLCDRTWICLLYTSDAADE